MSRTIGVAPNLSAFILDQGEGPVLERPAAVPLGVEVAHFLDLEGSLHGDGLSVSLPQDEAVLLVLQPQRDPPALVPALQGHAEADGEPHERVPELVRLVQSRRVPQSLIPRLAEPKGDEGEGCHLRGEGLRAGHGVLACRRCSTPQLGRIGR